MLNGESKPPLLSVVVPCFNEVGTIDRLLHAVAGSSYPNQEVIVVDDGSADGTRERLRDHLAPAGLATKVLYQDRNRGKGAALRAGFAAATGDILIVQDADLEYDPAQFPRIIAPILEGHADVVYGSRFMGAEPHRVLYYWHRVGNGVLTQLSNMFTNLNLTDMETCYKAFRRDVIASIRIEEDRFGFEPEITAKVAKLGCRVYEVGIAYHGRTYAEGKKVSWTDGLRAIVCIVKYNVFR